MQNFSFSLNSAQERCWEGITQQLTSPCWNTFSVPALPWEPQSGWRDLFDWAGKMCSWYRAAMLEFSSQIVSSVCVWHGCHLSGYCTSPVPCAAVCCHSRALSMTGSTSCPGQLGCTSHRNISMERNNLSWPLSSSCPDVAAHLCVHYLMNAVGDATLWWGAELRSLEVTWEVKN